MITLKYDLRHGCKSMAVNCRVIIFNQGEFLKCSFTYKMWKFTKLASVWSTYNRFNTLVQLVQSLSCVWLFVTPWTAAHQASWSITNSQSLLKPMSIESVTPSKYLILCHALLLPPSNFPSIKSFLMSQLFTSGGQSIRVSA